jgi:hypothetical protein
MEKTIVRSFIIRPKYHDVQDHAVREFDVDGDDVDEEIATKITVLEIGLGRKHKSLVIIPEYSTESSGIHFGLVTALHCKVTF